MSFVKRSLGMPTLSSSELLVKEANPRDGCQ
jgi:hypothetical protein